MTNKQNPTEMEKYRSLLLYAAKEGQIKLQGMGGYESDESYSKPATELLAYYQLLCEGDFVFLVKTVSSKDNLKKEEVERFNKVINDFNAKNAELTKAFTEGNKELLKHFIPKQ